MVSLADTLKTLLDDRDGVAALDYALIGTALMGMVLVGFQVLADGLANVFSVAGSL
jgi:Flp pilus assembly pilin Flp